MAIIKWIFWITVWVLVGAFFHYTLPQTDIVRVSDTYEKRIDFGENSIFWASADVGNDGATINRDVFFIQTRRVKDYYAIKHYGWRNEFLSIFPNAISIRAVDGPDAPKGIPFLNIFILIVFFAVVWAIYVRWRRFRTANIDPTLEAMEDGLEERRQGVSKWLGTWRSKK